MFDFETVQLSMRLSPVTYRDAATTAVTGRASTNLTAVFAVFYIVQTDCTIKSTHHRLIQGDQSILPGIFQPLSQARIMGRVRVCCAFINILGINISTQLL